MPAIASVATRYTRSDRLDVLESGYPAYGTSVGWFHYGDEVILKNTRRARWRGISAYR